MGPVANKPCIEGLEERHGVKQRLDHVPVLDCLSVCMLGLGPSPSLTIRG
jgi:hypothetical protein